VNLSELFSDSRCARFESDGKAKLLAKDFSGLLTKTGVAVEKLKISEIRTNLGDRKCLGDQRESFVGHPDAI